HRARRAKLPETRLFSGSEATVERRRTAGVPRRQVAFRITASRFDSPRAVATAPIPKAPGAAGPRTDLRRPGRPLPPGMRRARRRTYLAIWRQFLRDRLQKPARSPVFASPAPFAGVHPPGAGSRDTGLSDSSRPGKIVREPRPALRSRPPGASARF